MGRKIEGGEKRRKSNSRSIRNKKYKEIPIILFFSCGGGGEKTRRRGEDQRKESCEIKSPIWFSIYFGGREEQMLFGT